MTRLIYFLNSYSDLVKTPCKYYLHACLFSIFILYSRNFKVVSCHFKNGAFPVVQIFYLMVKFLNFLCYGEVLAYLKILRHPTLGFLLYQTLAYQVR